MNRFRVLVVEDQTMPRQLFEMLIQSSEEFALAASIDNAEMEAAANIKRQTPQVKIIVVTSMPECSYIDRARSIGVESFWYKETSDQSILDIMRRTMAGESVYPDAAPELNLGYASSYDFTDRELEVLREMTGGYTNTEIGQHLHMSVSSVKSHIMSMLGKTGFRNRTELAVRARESGLVILDRPLSDEPN